MAAAARLSHTCVPRSSSLHCPTTPRILKFSPATACRSPTVAAGFPPAATRRVTIGLCASAGREPARPPAAAPSADNSMADGGCYVVDFSHN
eukprot:jgi/Tetstr1/432372/TSEL_021769.t1